MSGQDALLCAFAASQDALDRWVQPEVERREWRWQVRMVWGGRYEAWVMDAGGRKHWREAATAPLARCLAWLEADKQWEGGNG